jgi:hypothetical protein
MGEEYKTEQDEAHKRADDKNQLKNRQFYGAMYQ